MPCESKSAHLRIHDIRTLLEDPMKAVANLKSHAELKKYTTTTTRVHTTSLQRVQQSCQMSLRHTDGLS